MTRWVGVRMPDVGLLEDTPVTDVLSYQERCDSYKLVARARPTFEAGHNFVAAALTGYPLEALLSNYSGAAHENLLGILTVHDLPRLPAP